MNVNGPMLHLIETWAEAKKFVRIMWVAMYSLYERDQTIYDSDIEEKIHSLLAHVGLDDNPT